MVLARDAELGQRADLPGRCDWNRSGSLNSRCPTGVASTTPTAWTSVVSSTPACRCREAHPASSRDESILVDESAEYVAPTKLRWIGIVDP
jgi:hypothetical protein